MKQMKTKSLLWKMGLQKTKTKPKKNPPTSCNQNFCQAYRKLVVVPCTSFFNKGTITCMSHCVQVRFLNCTCWQKQFNCKKTWDAVMSQTGQTKAVRNNSVVFSRCCHREIHQWLHMPLSLIDLGHSGVFVFLFCFYQEVQCFCWAVDLNKMCVWITVMHFMQFISCEYKCSFIYSFVSDFFLTKCTICHH